MTQLQICHSWAVLHYHWYTLVFCHQITRNFLVCSGLERECKLFIIEGQFFQLNSMITVENMKKSSQIEISKSWQIFPRCFMLIVLDLLMQTQLIPGHLNIRYHFHQTFCETVSILITSVLWFKWINCKYRIGCQHRNWSLLDRSMHRKQEYQF